MVKVIIITGAAIVVIAIVVAVLFFFKQPLPDVSGYESLTSPRIVILPKQKMIEVTVNGDPNKVLAGAFSSLFQVYYAIKETPKGPKQAPPRLRCSIPESLKFDEMTPGKSLIATVGIPVPETVTTLPNSKKSGSFEVKLADWEYGDSAEILHKGPYDKEQPTIEKLLAYIKSQVYIPAGIHEEEYLIGPGMGGAGPDKYVTIIRYPVVKATK